MNGERSRRGWGHTRLRPRRRGSAARARSAPGLPGRLRHHGGGGSIEPAPRGGAVETESRSPASRRVLCFGLGSSERASGYLTPRWPGRRGSDGEAAAASRVRGGGGGGGAPRGEPCSRDKRQRAMTELKRRKAAKEPENLSDKVV